MAKIYNLVVTSGPDEISASFPKRLTKEGLDQFIRSFRNVSADQLSGKNVQSVIVRPSAIILKMPVDYSDIWIQWTEEQPPISSYDGFDDLDWGYSSCRGSYLSIHHTNINQLQT